VTNSAAAVGWPLIDTEDAMGFLEDAKDKLTEAVDKAGDKIGTGIDKARDLIDEKTGHKHDEQLDAGAEKVKDSLDDLDGKDDGIN